MHDVVDDDKPAVYAHMPKWNLYLFRIEEGKYKCQNGYSVICLLSKSPWHFTRVIDARYPHHILFSSRFFFPSKFSSFGGICPKCTGNSGWTSNRPQNENYWAKSARWGTEQLTHTIPKVFCVVTGVQCTLTAERTESWVKEKIMWRVHLSSSRTKQR